MLAAWHVDYSCLVTRLRTAPTALQHKTLAATGRSVADLFAVLEQHIMSEIVLLNDEILAKVRQLLTWQLLVCKVSSKSQFAANLLKIAIILRKACAY